MRRHLIIVTSLMVLAANTAPAWAGWGCGAHRADGGNNRNFKFATKEMAIKDLQEECNSVGPCGDISCRPGINTQAQALAVWPQQIPGQLGYTPRESAMGCSNC